MDENPYQSPQTEPAPTAPWMFKLFIRLLVAVPTTFCTLMMSMIVGGVVIEIAVPSSIRASASAFLVIALCFAAFVISVVIATAYGLRWFFKKAGLL